MPAFVRALFIKSSTEVELSYCIKKNPACRILRLRRVALATLFHSAAVRSLAERFLCHRAKFPMTQKVPSMISHEKGEISAVPPLLIQKNFCTSLKSLNADKAWTTTAISPSRFQSYLPFPLSLRRLPADGPLSLSRELKNVLLFFSTFRIDHAPVTQVHRPAKQLHTLNYHSGFTPICQSIFILPHSPDFWILTGK